MAQFENKPRKGFNLELRNSGNGKFPSRSIPEFLSSKFNMIHYRFKQTAEVQRRKKNRI